jgi:Acetyltransferase (GNAT) domain
LRNPALHEVALPDGQWILRPWTSGDETWNDLATADNGATLYHDPRWLRLLEEAYGFKIVIAAIAHGSQLAAACLLARAKNPFKPRLVALPFSDTCPPLATDPSALCGLADGLMRQAPSRGGCEVRGVALPDPWQVVNCFEDWAVDLRRPLAELQRRCASHFRRQVRRAVETGLSVHCGSSLDDLYDFYQLMVETRSHQGIPVQPLRFFKRVHQLFSPAGDIEIWSVRQGGQPIVSGLMLRSFGGLHYKWSARRADSQAGAAQALTWSVIERHAGISQSLNLGRADSRNTGLVRFKKESGAEPAPLPYSFYPSAPNQVSAEVLSGPMKVLSQAWRRLPPSATRALSTLIYRYMA